jgi:hypothetical protein
MLIDPDYNHKRNLKRRAKNDAKTPDQKEADHKKARQYRQEHADAYAKSYYKWRSNNMDHFKAQRYAYTFTSLKDKCEKCGATENLVRHHDDYTKPLTVTTLCRKCHGLWHRDNIPKGTPKDVVSYFANRHCDSCKKIWPSCGRFKVSINGRSCNRWEHTDKNNLAGENKNEL